MKSVRLGVVIWLIVFVLLCACSPGPSQEPGAEATKESNGEATLAPASGGAQSAPDQPDAGPVNLVAAQNGGRVVSVTDELEYYTASNLIDGYKLDGGEWWTSEYPDLPQAVVFELGQDRVSTIDRVVLNPWTSEWRFGWIKDFEIYVSEDSPNLEEMGWVGSFTLSHYGIDQTFTFDPIRARYVGLVATSHYGSDEGVTLNEFEVYAASSDAIPVEPFYPSREGNLVAESNGGSIVDYSSEDSSGDWGVGHLNDGENDTETAWSSSEDLEVLQYITFSFPGDRSYLVDRVVLNPYSDGYEEDWVQEFELWGSDSTSDLEPMWGLGRFRLDQMGQDQVFTFDPVELRYIAFVPVSNYGGTEYTLNEFEVYEVGALAIGETGGLGLISTQHRAEEPVGEPVELPPEAPPQITNVSTDFTPRTVATSGDSPLEDIEFEVSYGELVPVLYHLYGPYFEDLVQIALANHDDKPVKLRVESTVPNYTETSVSTVSLEPGEAITVTQNPPLLPDAFDLLHGMKDASLHVKVDYLKEGEPRLIYEGTDPLRIYSRDDFPWGVPGYHTGGVFIPSMVTPNDPALDDLLRAAAEHSPDGQLVWGYSDDYDSDWRAWDTMKAIYEAVKEDYDVTYVATGVPFVSDQDAQEGFWLQRLKLPYEVLETHSGMCVELSLLFASAFEKMYLRPVMVLVPGHMYVGVAVSEDSETYYFLEGTMVGQYSFEEAVQQANRSFMEEALPYIESDRLDEYYWIDVWEAREEGIWPTPYR